MTIAMTADHIGSADPADPRMYATPAGRVRVEGLADTDRNYAIGCHLSPFAVPIIGPFALIVPLVLWLVRKDRSPFVDDHGREVINYLLSSALFSIVFVWTLVVPVVIAILVCMNLIRGSIAASNGEYFRFPMTIRFLT